MPRRPRTPAPRPSAPRSAATAPSGEGAGPEPLRERLRRQLSSDDHAERAEAVAAVLAAFTGDERVQIDWDVAAQLVAHFELPNPPEALERALAVASPDLAVLLAVHPAQRPEVTERIVLAQLARGDRFRAWTILSRVRPLGAEAIDRLLASEQVQAGILRGLSPLDQLELLVHLHAIPWLDALERLDASGFNPQLLATHLAAPGPRSLATLSAVPASRLARWLTHPAHPVRLATMRLVARARPAPARPGR